MQPTNRRTNNTQDQQLHPIARQSRERIHPTVIECAYRMVQRRGPGHGSCIAGVANDELHLVDTNALHVLSKVGVVDLVDHFGSRGGLTLKPRTSACEPKAQSSQPTTKVATASPAHQHDGLPEVKPIRVPWPGVGRQRTTRNAFKERLVPRYTTPRRGGGELRSSRRLLSSGPPGAVRTNQTNASCQATGCPGAPMGTMASSKTPSRARHLRKRCVSAKEGQRRVGVTCTQVRVSDKKHSNLRLRGAGSWWRDPTGPH
jgi:hypothetical protein